MSVAGAIADVAGRFAVTGRCTAAESLAGGHINDSYVLTLAGEHGGERYLLQRINAAVFPEPLRVMDNIERVTTHIANHLRQQRVGDLGRRVSAPLPSRDGRPYWVDDRGGVWRLYRLIEGTRVHPLVQTAAQAAEAGRAFGEFQRLLADWPGPRLHETIPGFHNTPLRYAALERAVVADLRGRSASAAPEIAFARARCSWARILLDLHERGEIPERVVHNDAKITNVLFDAATERAVCVVDLDTVMPGLSLYDFGDMVRSMTCPVAEDERELSKVELQESLFEALVQAYCGATGPMLTPVERQHLVTAGRLITLEQGVRFLTDHLNGDTYYKTRRPGQNLDRCRTQFKLVESIERQERTLRDLAARA